MLRKITLKDLFFGLVVALVYGYALYATPEHWMAILIALGAGVLLAIIMATVVPYLQGLLGIGRKKHE